MSVIVRSQILDPEIIENPYPFYRALQEEAPVYRVPGTPVYLVTSWELVHQALANQRDFSANLTGILIRSERGLPELFDLAEFGGTIDSLANADEPFHAVHRKLVLPQMNARRVSAMEAEVRDWARQGVARLVVRGGGDAVTELANPIPVKVMARLIGLPIEDVDLLLNWAFSGGDILSGTADLARMAQLSNNTRDMSAYLDEHLERALSVDRKTATPSSVLEELAVALRDGLISRDDAVGIMVVLVGAAGESTSSLVGSALRLLADNDPLQRRLRRNPDLIEAFVEEVVRLESPFKGHYREVVNETVLGGVTLPKTAHLMLMWAAANRDPSVFGQPDLLDIDRANKQDHLGFGHGIHFCIGARVARMEAREVLREILEQTALIELDPGHSPRHVSSIFVRRLPELHLRLQGRS